MRNSQTYFWNNSFFGSLKNKLKLGENCGRRNEKKNLERFLPGAYYVILEENIIKFSNDILGGLLEISLNRFMREHVRAVH